MDIELTDEQTAALLAELDRIINNDRYPLSPRIQWPHNPPAVHQRAAMPLSVIDCRGADGVRADLIIFLSNQCRQHPCIARHCGCPPMDAVVDD